MADLYFASQTDADRYAIEQQIAAHKQAPVRRITRSTAPLVAALERLERSRNALAAPIYKLSDDILREIFVIVTWDDGYADAESTLVLSQVVSRWRRTTLETPSLWTSVYLNAGWGYQCMHAFELLCPLSRTLPLRITVIYVSPPVAPGTARSDWCPVSILYPLSVLRVRCQVLRLEGGRAYVTTRRVIGMGMPILTKLSIQGGNMTAAGLYQELSGAPKLMSLVLDNCPLSASPPVEGTPLVVLSTLETLLVKYVTAPDRSIFSNNFPPQILTPGLRTLHLEARHVSRLKDFKHSSITSFHLLIKDPVSFLNVLTVVCNLTALAHLSLAVEIKEPDQAPTWTKTLPPLASIDFLSSKNIDKLARFLVDTTTARKVGCTVKTVRFSSSDVTPETRQWVSERVSVDDAERESQV